MAMVAPTADRNAGHRTRARHRQSTAAAAWLATRALAEPSASPKRPPHPKRASSLADDVQLLLMSIRTFGPRPEMATERAAGLVQPHLRLIDLVPPSDKLRTAQEIGAGVDNLAVVQHTSTLGQLFECCIKARRRTVWPVGSHGFGDVGDRDNSRFEADFIPPQTLRIPGSIQALMVLQGHPRYGGWVAKILQEIAPRLAVPSHDIELLARESGWAVENSLGHGQLPDVVKQTAQTYFVKVPSWQVQHAADLNRKLGDERLSLVDHVGSRSTHQRANSLIEHDRTSCDRWPILESHFYGHARPREYSPSRQRISEKTPNSLSATLDVPSPGIRIRPFSGIRTNRLPRIPGHRSRKAYRRGVDSEHCAPIATKIYVKLSMYQVLMKSVRSTIPNRAVRTRTTAREAA